MTKMKIFISSPQKGLKEEREYLIKKKTDIGIDISAMELFVASPHTPIDVCLRELQDSDLVILLVGPYYGSVDSATGISFTEIEYNEACDLGIPVFVFVKVKSAGAEWCAEDDDGRIRKKHLKFMEKICKEHYYQRFTASNELLRLIKPAIDKHKAESKKKYAPFVEYKEYFSAFLGKEKLFRHDYPLEGRENELRDMFNFMNSDKKILVIYGRGAIGKSKLLFEFAQKAAQEKNEEWKRTLFIRENIVFDERTLLEIPSGRSVLILEDAHRYGYFRNVLAIFSNTDLGDRIKLIISTRTSGKDYLEMILSTSPLDITEIQWLGEMKDLKIDETRRIVSNIVGRKNKGLVDYLAQMTKDCPLAAIIGSKLVMDKKIDPQQINNSEVFQRIVLNRFLEEIMKVKLEDVISIKLLNYISVLAPVRPADEKFIEKLSSILKTTYPDLRKNFDYLEEKGLLLRRGRLVRIVPDLLSDHILYNECVTRDGMSTTFADKVFEQFHESHTSNILANISEVEWRSSASSKAVNLLDKIWAEITEKFEHSHNYQRVQILSEIEKAAFFQPKPVLNIIKIAIDKPSTVKPQGEYARLLRDWDRYVIEKIPSLLKNIAYHLDYVKESSSILWELGKDDKRELNPYPEHPIRVLQDLASYHIKKTVIYHLKLIEFIEDLIIQPDVHNHKHSLLGVLDELLKKEGEFTESRGATFTMSTFRLNVRNILPIRKRALNILRKCFSAGSPPCVIFRAFESLRYALSYPVGSFGRIITNEEEKEWLPEQLEIIDIIKEGAKEISNNALDVLIKKELRWFQLHGRHDELKNKVNNLLDSIEEDYDFRLYRAVAGNFIGYHDTSKSFEEREKEVAREILEVTKLLAQEEKKPGNIFMKLNFIINEYDKLKVSINPNHLFSEITKQCPETAFSLYDLGIKEPEKPIMRFSSPFIWPMSKEEKHRERLRALIKQGLNTKNFNLCINIAHAYAWGGLIESYQNDDIDNLKFLIGLKNNEILNTTLYAIAKLGKKDSKKAFNLILAIDLNEKIVDQLFGAFGKTHGIPSDSLQKEEIENLLSKLIPIDIFRGQHYHVDKFLEFVSKEYPGLSVSFLLDRLQYSREERPTKEYAPLPYLGFDYAFVGISNNDNYETYVRKVRDLSLQAENLDTFWLPKLFEAISDNYSERALTVLAEWLDSKEAIKIKGISLLLRDAPDTFLFTKHEFIGELVLRANDISGKCLKNVQSNLFGIAISGTRSSSFGVPSDKSVKLRDRGKEIAKKFDVSHPAHKFYMDVSSYGEEEITEELQRDEEILDE